jgi:hypothetical protein
MFLMPFSGFSAYLVDRLCKFFFFYFVFKFLLNILGLMPLVEQFTSKFYNSDQVQ